MKNAPPCPANSLHRKCAAHDHVERGCSALHIGMWGTALLCDVAHLWRTCGLLRLRNLPTVGRLGAMILDQTRRNQTRGEVEDA